jgi:hypothetical protein
MEDEMHWCVMKYLVFWMQLLSDVAAEYIPHDVID